MPRFPLHTPGGLWSRNGLHAQDAWKGKPEYLRDSRPVEFAGDAPSKAATIQKPRYAANQAFSSPPDMPASANANGALFYSITRRKGTR